MTEMRWFTYSEQVKCSARRHSKTRGCALCALRALKNLAGILLKASWLKLQLSPAGLCHRGVRQKIGGNLTVAFVKKVGPLQWRHATQLTVKSQWRHAKINRKQSRMHVS